MTITTTLLAVALTVSGAPAVAGQSNVRNSTPITGSATIQAIDSTNRTITLRDESGVEDTYTAGPEVKRFSELKVGDTVKMTYYESVFVQVRKPGESPAGTSGEKVTGGTAVDAAITPGQGALPGATAAVQEKMTVTVKAVDAAVPSITVTTADGRTVTRKVLDKKLLDGVKAGDQIDVTYTRALLTQIERAQ